ncbi:MAG: hypothetical protein Q8N97_08135 [Methanobacteriaceae archaeon]|nr:hypothetical protein [Methanobacteriaceae archaeon]MDP3034013.1 hypothetical protein [Methanobacteriaceae archaeon]
MHLPQLEQNSLIHRWASDEVSGRFSALIKRADILCLGPNSGVINNPCLPIFPSPASFANWVYTTNPPAG